ncbi:lasso peptide biosynthesis PqqD family chaperone [Bacillus sp. OK048]|uniref:lasso peptide biosynthesis PqqD family chaperone n=1 Tax=Bacillus sp. OK048 TaxID=1882761 RepID=UPI00088188B3|nr:lasso peptide biosynthesis PqqD family chaperone [Bacillus sp. OK048]SDM77369.1 Coenzyme PQQ synthesis protein D (PqqD) [Bacillus sp. OK048]
MKMLSVDKLSMETTIVQSPGNIISDMDGETVMISIDNGKYYNLGTIGGHIWKSIKIPITINKLISKLTSEFDVEISECQQEVIPFLEQLLNENIIKIEKGL